MSDPKLKRTKIVIAYGASDGYRQELTARGGTGTKHIVTGEEVPPEKALIDGIKELARLCELFGYGNASRMAVAEAQEAVVKWRDARQSAAQAAA